MRDTKTNDMIINWLENIIIKRTFPEREEIPLSPTRLCVRYGEHIFTFSEWEKLQEEFTKFKIDLENRWDFQ